MPLLPLDVAKPAAKLYDPLVSRAKMANAPLIVAEPVRSMVIGDMIVSTRALIVLVLSITVTAPAMPVPPLAEESIAPEPDTRIRRASSSAVTDKEPALNIGTSDTRAVTVTISFNTDADPDTA